MNGDDVAARKRVLRGRVKVDLEGAVGELNRALSGEGLEGLTPTLERVASGRGAPHWLEQLASERTLPNLDGKTVGSVIEMLFVAVLETTIFDGDPVTPLRINPAKGVDLPDLDLGLKCPSENYCTSEPFFSPYEMLIGSEHDAIVLLTDYQTAKKHPPLRLRIINSDYLAKTELADRTLCRIARKHRAWLLEENEAWARRVFRFLVYVNQGDFRGRYLLELVAAMRDLYGDPDPDAIASVLDRARRAFNAGNRLREDKGAPPIPSVDLERLEEAVEAEPTELGVISAADDWVEETHKDFARSPNENEWHRLIEGPLNGRIGMSYALQWRYNFRQVFADG